MSNKIISIKKRRLDLNAEINRLKKENEELRQHNKNLENFTTLTCHDIAQPLRVFSTHLEMLTASHLHNLNNDGKYLLERINLAINKMTKLHKGLIELILVKSYNESVSLCDTRLIMKKFVEPLITNNSSFIIEYGEMIPIKAHERFIISLFKNLIENAIKYSKREPHIKIWSKKFKGGIVYAVKDNGIGIPLKAQYKIFSLGYRASGSHNKNGSGIGLTICERILSTYGGKIWVHSKIEKGSTFYLFFPSLNLKPNKLA